MTDFTKILNKAKELEAKMKESQEKIKNIKVEGMSGANSVKVTLNGDGEMIQIDISPETMNNVINKSLTELDTHYPDWNVIMLATANKVLDKDYNKLNKLKNNNNNNTKPLPIDLGLVFEEEKKEEKKEVIPLNIEKLKSATTASAYIVKKDYVNHILDLFNHCNNNMLSTNMSSKGNPNMDDVLMAKFFENQQES